MKNANPTVESLSIEIDVLKQANKMLKHRLSKIEKIVDQASAEICRTIVSGAGPKYASVEERWLGVQKMLESAIRDSNGAEL